MDYLDIALRSYNKHKENGSYYRKNELHFNMDGECGEVQVGALNNYPWVVSLHGITRWAYTTGNAADLEFIREEVLSYAMEEIEFSSTNLMNYRCGGNGTAFMFMEGHLPEASDVVKKYADELLYDAARSKEGIFGRRQEGQEDKVWIDVAFAVCPFLLFSGIGLGEDKYIEEACQQMIKMYELLYDESTGLLHQARGFQTEGFITEDCWSRGNGWGMYALTELINYLPSDYPLRSKIEKLYIQEVDACIKYQDNLGMWHQEMTCIESYPEMSGTCLIGYGIGVGLEKGILSEDYKEYFDCTVEGVQSYIALDGSVFNCCVGCLAPGEGKKQDYIDRMWAMNDSHAFGPVMLLMVQAGRLERITN